MEQYRATGLATEPSRRPGEGSGAVVGLGVAAAAMIALATVGRAAVLTWIGWLAWTTSVRAASSSFSLGGFDDDRDTFYASVWAAFVVLLVVVVAGLVTVAWTLVARVNAERVPGPSPRWARPWAVLAWLVPLANLVLTPLVLTDLWRASGESARRPVPVAVWWGAGIAALIVHVIGVANGGVVATLAEARVGLILAMVEAVCELVAGAALAVTVLRIAARQRSAATQPGTADVTAEG